LGSDPRTGEPSTQSGMPRVLRWLLPIALLAMLVELAIIVLPFGRGEPGGPNQTAVRSQTEPQPTSTPAPVAKAAGVPTAQVKPTPPPTATPVPEPTPTAIPPTAPPTPEPTPTAAAARAAAATPGQAVTSFYQLVAQQQFELATQLWTPRMQAAYPPAENIRRRFAQTEEISLRRADIISMDEAAGRATVAVDLVEVTSFATRRYVGTWQLVRAGAGWLLDQPNLQAG
jgi:hypothetical protein